MVDTSSPLDNEPPDGVASDLRAEGEQLLADAAAGYEAGDFDSCRRFAEGAEAIFVRLGDDQRALAARQRQAMAWAVQGDLGRAVQLNTTLIEAYTELGDTMSAAKCLTNLGVNLQMLGRRAAAIDAFTTARRAFARHGDRVFELAMTHMNLGALQRLEGRAGLGLAHSRRAAQLFGGLAHGGSRVVDCLRHVSLALDDLGRPEEAEDVRTRAERLARDAGDIVRAPHHAAAP